jgi:uncharacterized protein YlxW (UPF0749 family)
MSIIHAEPLTETVAPAPPMKDAEIIVLIEDLRSMQEKANELAAQQLELTKQIETALKKVRELHQKSQTDQKDVGGEA